MTTYEVTYHSDAGKVTTTATRYQEALNVAQRFDVWGYPPPTLTEVSNEGIRRPIPLRDGWGVPLWDRS